MKAILVRLARWLLGKSATRALPAPQLLGSMALDAYHRLRAPTPAELVAELKNTAWTCASINAAACASLPPRLYVTTTRGQAPPRCATRSLHAVTLNRLRDAPHLAPFMHKAAAIEEVLDHPLLTLLRQVNPVHNAFDLWELSALYLEVNGSAYWLLDVDPALNVPSAIWILPAHLVTPARRPASTSIVDYYEYRGQRLEKFAPERIIHLRFPDPRDPYTAGLS